MHKNKMGRSIRAVVLGLFLGQGDGVASGWTVEDREATTKILTTQPQGWNILPDELILKIFQYLTPFERWQSEAVCKSWCCLLKDPTLSIVPQLKALGLPIETLETRSLKYLVRDLVYMQPYLQRYWEKCLRGEGAPPYSEQGSQADMIGTFQETPGIAEVYLCRPSTSELVEAYTEVKKKATRRGALSAFFWRRKLDPTTIVLTSNLYRSFLTHFPPHKRTLGLNRWLDLPQVLKEEIFSYIPFEQVLSLKLVCKNWRQAIWGMRAHQARELLCKKPAEAIQAFGVAQIRELLVFSLTQQEGKLLEDFGLYIDLSRLGSFEAYKKTLFLLDKLTDQGPSDFLHKFLFPSQTALAISTGAGRYFMQSTREYFVNEPLLRCYPHSPESYQWALRVKIPIWRPIFGPEPVLREDNPVVEMLREAIRNPYGEATTFFAWRELTKAGLGDEQLKGFVPKHIQELVSLDLEREQLIYVYSALPLFDRDCIEDPPIIGFKKWLEEKAAQTAAPNQDALTYMANHLLFCEQLYQSSQVYICLNFLRKYKIQLPLAEQSSTEKKIFSFNSQEGLLSYLHAHPVPKARIKKYLELLEPLVTLDLTPRGILPPSWQDSLK